jgi:hypothetical protein
MEPEISLSCSQDPANSPTPELDESGPQPTNQPTTYLPTYLPTYLHREESSLRS